MTSIWNLGRLDDRRRAAPDHDLETGGVTGLSTALRLLEQGRKVAVLEAHRIGEGNTGNSTGNLYATLSQGLAGVRAKWDDDALRTAVAARRDCLASSSARPACC